MAWPMNPWPSLQEARLLPVVMIDDAATADGLADAMVEAGCSVIEVVLRTEAALPAIERLASRSDIVVAAGTVLSDVDVARVVDAGADLVVTPGFDASVVDRCVVRGIPVLPGVGSAGDVMAARNAGLTAVKLFPAHLLGGPDMVMALSGPFPDMMFVPSGGVDRTSARAYAALPAVLAVSGSWMAPRDALASRDFTTIKRLVADAVAVVSKPRAA